MSEDIVGSDAVSVRGMFHLRIFSPKPEQLAKAFLHNLSISESCCWLEEEAPMINDHLKAQGVTH